MILMVVTIILIIVTMIPITLTATSNINYVPFTLFPIVSPPLILEALKMQTFWRKANRYPFEITLIFVSYTKARTDYTKLEEKTNKIQNIYTDKRT